MAERIREVDVLFLSTLSLRRATWMQRKQCWCMIQFLSTLSLRRATYSPKRSRCTEQYFYPRSPCGERLIQAMPHLTAYLFLSTLSLRRATIFPPVDTSSVSISIHALLAESDQHGNAGGMYQYQFLSTLSLRRATHYGWSWYDDFTISIHALLAESDVPVDGAFLHQAHFYPRSPCGERRARVLQQKWPGQFLSTLSLRRATSVTTSFQGGFAISIHALLAESDAGNNTIRIR